MGGRQLLSSDLSDDFERLKLALDSADSAAYDWTASDDHIIWCGDSARLLGVAENQAPATGHALALLLGSDIREYRRRLFTSPSASDEHYSFAYPVDRKDHGVAWIEERGRRIRDANGKITRAVGILRDITEARQAEARLRYLSSNDELTGLLNRAHFQEALQNVINESRRSARNAVYMLIGIDDLALVNQTYGFAAADQIIVAAGKRIAAHLRAGDILGRTSGNKFGIILVDHARQDVAEMAQKLREAVRSAVIETPKGTVCATVSAGACLLSPEVGTSEEAMVRAEEALDLAKRSGRDRFSLHQSSDQQDSLRRRTVAIADQIVEAMNDRRIALAYQPIVDAVSGRIVSYESLLRIVQRGGQVVAAAEFIPVAERVGLIRLLDQRALELALQTLRDHKDLHLTLNVSAMTASDGAWLELLLSQLRGGDLAPRLTVELTETAMLHDIDFSAHFISSLRQSGCKTALDDFGAGYTSFRNLQLFRTDLVKIDGSFIMGLLENPDNQFFVRTLVGLAQNFNVKTVAECVGSAQEAELLKKFGVDFLQGFHFGRPEVEPSWLRSSQTRLQA